MNNKMKSKYLMLGILVLVILGIIFISGCAKQEVHKPPHELTMEQRIDIYLQFVFEMTLECAERCSLSECFDKKCAADCRVEDEMKKKAEELGVSEDEEAFSKNRFGKKIISFNKCIEACIGSGDCTSSVCVRECVDMWK